MSDDSVIMWIQQWRATQCDGDWEHQYGIRIGTLDNPGWEVAIDLTDTELEYEAFLDVRIERTEDDWIVCRLEGQEGEKKFRGYGGLYNLTELLNVFRSWVEQASKAK